VVIDYCRLTSPSACTPHIRSTIIGEALVNIHRAHGYTVIGDNHLGDWESNSACCSPRSTGAACLREKARAARAVRATVRRFREGGGARPTLDDEARHWSLRLEQGIWPRARHGSAASI
jgi:arginyl-tRNA synthetase